MYLFYQQMSYNAALPFIKNARKNDTKNINSIIENDKNLKRKIVC